MPQPEVIKQEDLGTLYPQEVELIWLMRNRWRYGSIEIVVRDGIPVDLIRTVERHRVGSGLKRFSTPEPGENE